MRVNLHKLIIGLILLIYVVGYNLQIKFLNNIYLSEIVSLIFVLTFGICIRMDTNLKKFLISYFLILSGLIISDFINNSNIQDYTRGWAGIAVATANLIFLYYIYSVDVRYIFLYFIGLILRLLFIDYDNLNLIELINNKNLFKVYFLEVYFAFTLITLYCIERWRKKYLNIFLLILIAISIFFLNARGAGLIFILTYLTINYIFKGKFGIFSIIILLNLLILLYVLYVNLVIYFQIEGSTLSALRFMDNYNNPLDFLMVTRTDFFVALSAISEKPIFGWGSWAYDPSGFYLDLFQQLHGNQEYDGSFIPAHSVILTSWLWGGLLSLVGAIYFIVNMMKIAKPIKYYDNGYRIISIALCIGLLFDFLFSPFGVLRVSFPSIIALILVLDKRLKNSLND
jgi:O-antigen ligase